MKRILIVDDEQSMREMLVILLKKEGLDVRPAGSRAEAAAVLERGFDSGKGPFFEIAAGFAELQPLERYFPDAKRFADQVVQRHSLRQEIPPRVEMLDRVVELVVRGPDCFAGDQRHFIFGLAAALELRCADSCGRTP